MGEGERSRTRGDCARSAPRGREEQDTRRLRTQRAVKEWLERMGGGLGSDGAAPCQELDIPRYVHPHPHPFLALREGGVAGVEGGLAPKERCLPPPGRQKEGGSDSRA